MNKQKLKAIILEMEKHQLKYIEENYNMFFQNAKIDRGKSNDDQEQAIAENSSILAEAFDCPIHNHQDAIRKLNAINFGEKSMVEPGSIVRFSDRYLIVGIATAAFEHDGRSYIGVSTEAPIYKVIRGLKAGDEFEFNDRKYQIQNVS